MVLNHSTFLPFTMQRWVFGRKGIFGFDGLRWFTVVYGKMGYDI